MKMINIYWDEQMDPSIYVWTYKDQKYLLMGQLATNRYVDGKILILAVLIDDRCPNDITRVTIEGDHES